MLKWVQSGLSAVAGTAEPEYGREAIYTVADSINQENVPVYRETTVQDFNWQSPNYTNVETQTFYFTDLTNGLVGFLQVIHSNVMGVHTTAQFTCRLFNVKNPSQNIWHSTKLDNFEIKQSNFYADNFKIEFDENNQDVVINSTVNDDLIVDFKISKLAPGIVFGKDGTTLYGEDKSEPWGSMRHLFWPRCKVSGKITNNETEETLSINGYTMFVMALQGMKPHHAAKAWNFMNFHSENYSAVTMEFTTPPSYANTKVNVGIVSSNDKILYATINNQVVHKAPVVDEIGWPIPTAIEFNYVTGKKYDTSSPLTTTTEQNEEEDEQTSAEAKAAKEADIKARAEDVGTPVAKVAGDLSTLVERVDVMAEIPQFVKNIVSGVAGTKPYIYQYCNEFDITINESNDNEINEKGIGFTEVTFISE